MMAVATVGFESTIVLPSLESLGRRSEAGFRDYPAFSPDRAATNAPTSAEA